MIRLSVRCSPEQAEVVLAELVQLAPNGVEEESGPGWVEYAIYGGEGELPELGDMRIPGDGGQGVLEINSQRIPDDWADRWRDFHQPTPVAGGRIVIRPSWHEAGSIGTPGRDAEEPPVVDIVIDPGQAFGTGAHPTTRMCVELLVGLADEGSASGALTDLGTGSAVLAIAAAKLGWGPVTGFDLELAALDAAGENARANGVEVALERVNLRETVPPLAASVTANLMAPLLRDVASNLAEAPEILILSGLLTEEAAEVASHFERLGMTVDQRLDSGDWAALLLR